MNDHLAHLMQFRADRSASSAGDAVRAHLSNQGDPMDQSIIAKARPDDAPKPTPQQAGYLARAAYRAHCEQFGREPDPVMADEEYWRAYRKAEGQIHFAGD